MNDISREYATALFMLACEDGAQKEYADALARMKGAFEEMPEYFAFLSSPAISRAERVSSVDEVFGDGLAENAVSYLKLMCEKGRMQYFYESVDAYMELYAAFERKFRARIISAVELDEAQKQKLTEKLSAVYGGEVVGEFIVDSALIGGLIVEIDGKIMDGSIIRRLHDVKDVINT